MFVLVPRLPGFRRLDEHIDLLSDSHCVQDLVDRSVFITAPPEQMHGLIQGALGIEPSLELLPILVHGGEWRPLVQIQFDFEVDYRFSTPKVPDKRKVGVFYNSPFRRSSGFLLPPRDNCEILLTNFRMLFVERGCPKVKVWEFWELWENAVQ